MSRALSYLTSSAGRLIRRSLHRPEVVPHKVVHCSCALQEGQQTRKLSTAVEAGEQACKDRNAVQQSSGKGPLACPWAPQLLWRKAQWSVCGLSGRPHYCWLQGLRKRGEAA